MLVLLQKKWGKSEKTAQNEQIYTNTPKFRFSVQCILDYPAMLGNLFQNLGRIRKVSIVGCPPSTTYTTLKRT